MNARCVTVCRAFVASLLLLQARATFTQDCQPNTNPLCAAATNLGTISGDSGTPQFTRTGTTEAYFYANVREDVASTRNLNARVRLHSPPGQDFDLVVRCASCASTVMRTSANSGTGGHYETVDVKRTDNFTDNSFTMVIEIRHRVGTGCAQWTLEVFGNSTPPSGTTPLSCG